MTIITHDGVFHADEVTAIALLETFRYSSDVTIKRTRSARAMTSADMLVDVGGVYDPEKKYFDHHQEDYDGKLSSAGMV